MAERPLWNAVTAGRVVAVSQQLVEAAELQAAHVAGEELHPHVRETVEDASGAV